MKGNAGFDERLLNDAEREIVALAMTDRLAGQSDAELEALIKRLRNARDRARRIGRQQKREILGKADAKAARPARENAGTEAKAQVLVDALNVVSAHLKRRRAPSQAALSRKAAATKAAATAGPSRPSSGRTAKAGMTAKTSTRPTVKSDPREVGRVSKAGKVAQAKRDR